MHIAKEPWGKENSVLNQPLRTRELDQLGQELLLI